MFAINLSKVISIHYEREVLESELDELSFITGEEARPHRIRFRMDLRNPNEDSNVYMEFKSQVECIDTFIILSKSNNFLTIDK